MIYMFQLYVMDMSQLYRYSITFSCIEISSLSVIAVSRSLVFSQQLSPNDVLKALYAYHSIQPKKLIESRLKPRRGARVAQ